MYFLRRSSFFLLSAFIIPFMSYGQQTPFNPVSYRVFSPFVFNPAIAGSKDFFSVDLIAGWMGKTKSQIISGNARLVKSIPGYISSPAAPEFTNFGIGGYIFDVNNSAYRNLGAGITASYQIPLNNKHLSFLSFGVSVKGIFNSMDSVASTDPALSKPAKNSYFPEFDLGVYYYSPTLFAGLSATNIPGNPEHSDSLGLFRIPVSRQYFLIAGYKILISRSFNIVLEPSAILITNDSLSHKISDILKPELKLYMENFCVGTYFNDYHKISFFLQYKYPRFYVGTFFEIPKNSPYYKKGINVEIAAGLNLSNKKLRSAINNHW